MGGTSMKRSRERILKILQKNQNIVKGYGVRRLSLFGSCARGEESEASDLDFLVEFEKNSFDAYMDLKIFLEDLFGCKIDLVLTDSIKPRLREPILREAVHVPGL
jgi:predicted nucleotidyltransferase